MGLDKMKSQVEIEEAIDQMVATYFIGSSKRVSEVAIPSLNERLAIIRPDGREVYLSIPFDRNSPKPDWKAIKEYIVQHPKARLLLWLNGEIKEL